ncbi:RNA 2'-phosphotransferase [Pseudanabaena sp. PCC 6802]|uniref:RNA 2'-phosphotransferase n=1 Tax=Pseudanabaena sp. PCC 6802 TaxID=118173 RepID=UPI000349D179|nr:RNA 2'-phosphotransferase [Pseudanabaena sp. PCC 6802]
MSKNLESTSKFLSLVLRHRPETIGLALDEAGWANVESLIELATKHKHPLSRELIEEIVAKNDKKRFSLSADSSSIRANQGHSVKVNLGLAIAVPPELLYHGTATRFIESIKLHGLIPGSRQHVHLSFDIETAAKVGQRHGKPIVLIVKALQMYESGRSFYLSDNGVWLTESVPTTFIQFP